MRLAFSFFAILPFLLASSGCAELSRAGFDVATPGSGLLPPKPGAVTEAFAWPITAIGLGAAGGSAAAGAIAQSWGWRPGFVAVVAAGAATAGCALP